MRYTEVACCHSGSQGAAAKCACNAQCSAVTHAQKHGARRSGPHKCQPRSGQAHHRARQRRAGCEPHVTESTLQAAELGLTMVLDLGRCERCLVGRGCIIVSSPAPSCMQRHAASLTAGHPRRPCVEVLTACKEKEREMSCLLCTTLAFAMHDYFSPGAKCPLPGLACAACCRLSASKLFHEARRRQTA